MNKYYSIMYFLYLKDMCVLSVHVCTHHMYAVPTKARRGCQIHWHEDYKGLWAFMWVLRNELGRNDLWKINQPVLLITE